MTTARAAVIRAVGGKGSVGTDFYLAASKLFLAQSVLLDATMRLTKANQFGILGFGGDKHADYSTQFEGSIVYLVSRNFAVGGEFRTKPSNLGVAREGAAFDVAIATVVQRRTPLGTAAILSNGPNGR